MTSSTPVPPIPPIAGGEEIYNRIMAGLEPELTTEGLKTLSEKYKDETSLQARERSERYRKAFEEYEKRFREESSRFDHGLQALEQQAIAALEEDNRTGENDQLKQLEASIDQL